MYWVPQYIRYDRQIRLRDPLTRAAQPVMKRLTDEVPTHAVVLLCRLFRSQVICVHQEFRDRPDYAISYERGDQSAPSCAELLQNHPRAHVIACRKAPVPKSRELCSRTRASEGTGAKLRIELGPSCTAGFSVTRGELDPGMCGIAVPILEAAGTVTGSLSVVIPAQHRGTRLWRRSPNCSRARPRRIRGRCLSARARRSSQGRLWHRKAAHQRERQKVKSPRAKPARHASKSAKRARA